MKMYRIDGRDADYKGWEYLYLIHEDFKGDFKELCRDLFAEEKNPYPSNRAFDVYNRLIQEYGFKDLDSELDGMVEFDETDL